MYIGMDQNHLTLLSTLKYLPKDPQKSAIVNTWCMGCDHLAILGNPQKLADIGCYYSRILLV